MTVRAREATSEERERLWPKVVKTYAGYQGYQDRTEPQRSRSSSWSPPGCAE